MVLLERGADINFIAEKSTRTSSSLSPLQDDYHTDIQDSYYFSTKGLVHGDDRIKFGDTPLITAIENGHIDIVSLLLERGAAVNIKKKDGPKTGVTPLLVACRQGSIEIVSLLLDRGADVNVKNKRGETPLIAACRKGRIDIVSLLLNRGVNVNVKTRAGVIPLIVGLYYSRESM